MSDSMDAPHKFVPVPPAQRRFRDRTGARIVVRAGDRVLLINDTDPGLPGSNWWVTPGGGVDAGESFEQAAIRELFEETGYAITPDQLVGPVARRRVSHGYSDQVLIQTEQFFIVDVSAPFQVDTAGYTPEERQTLQAVGWFTMAQVAQMLVWPAELATLFAMHAGDVCLDWGDVEESTVPV